MYKISAIRRLASGVPGLDEVLGGGILEFSPNLIVGGPGTGRRPSVSRSCSPTTCANMRSSLTEQR